MFSKIKKLWKTNYEWYRPRYKYIDKLSVWIAILFMLLSVLFGAIANININYLNDLYVVAIIFAVLATDSLMISFVIGMVDKYEKKLAGK